MKEQADKEAKERQKIKQNAPKLIPGGGTGLMMNQFPSFKGKTLLQGQFPNQGDILEFRLNNDPYFSECKVTKVLKRFFPQGYWVNVKILDGLRTENKEDVSVRCEPGDDNWSLKN